MELKKEFLYEAIEDSRSTIRAMDIKSHMISAVILSAMIILSRTSDNITILETITYIAGFFTMGAFLYGTILPRFNPIDKIEEYNIIQNNYLSLFFPIHQRNFSTYFSAIESLPDEDILKILALEKLKLQVIVDAKIDYFKIALYWFFGPFSVLLILSFII